MLKEKRLEVTHLVLKQDVVQKAVIEISFMRKNIYIRIDAAMNALN